MVLPQWSGLTRSLWNGVCWKASGRRKDISQNVGSKFPLKCHRSFMLMHVYTQVHPPPPSFSPAISSRLSFSTNWGTFTHFVSLSRSPSCYAPSYPQLPCALPPQFYPLKLLPTVPSLFRWPTSVLPSYRLKSFSTRIMALFVSGPVLKAPWELNVCLI